MRDIGARCLEIWNSRPGGVGTLEEYLAWDALGERIDVLQQGGWLRRHPARSREGNPQVPARWWSVLEKVER